MASTSLSLWEKVVPIRGCPSLSSGMEKVGQSVDFAARNGANLWRLYCRQVGVYDFQRCKEIGMILYHGCSYNKECICVDDSGWNLLNSSHIVSVDGYTNDEIKTLLQIKTIFKNVKKENRMCNIVCFTECPYV